MNPYTIPLETWQRLLDEYKADPATQYEQSPCFRVDGTPFSVGIFYGGFKYNGVRYTVVDTTEPGAYLALSPAFISWVRKRKEPMQVKRCDAGPNAVQLRLALEERSSL